MGLIGIKLTVKHVFVWAFIGVSM